MRAEILSIGTELLLGQIVDTNAQYLASVPAPSELRGHEDAHEMSVRDDR